MFFYRSPYRHLEILLIAKSSIGLSPASGISPPSPEKAFLPRWGNTRNIQAEIAAYFPQTSSATSFTSRSLFHCSSSVSLFPISQDANPHCGLRHSLSRGTNLDAS